MKFIFVDSFDLVWNGKTARYEQGVSGSHNAPMYLAEALAKDHVVELVSTKNNIIEAEYLNVKYINFKNFERTSCDYIVSTNFLTTLEILEKITSYKKILVLTHNELVHFGNFFNIDKKKILICYISEFAKRNILKLQPFLMNYDNMLLYNSIDLNDVPNFDTSEKQNSLCYFACIERGYKMTVEILKKINESTPNLYKLYTNTYYEPYRHLMNQNNDSVVIVENSSKKTIFDYLKKSKYFVYPLINLETGIVHYDTFAYVVLEALLMGVIVIAPKIGVYEELYGDAVCYIDTDGIISKHDLLNWKDNPYCKINTNFGYPLFNKYIEKINLLDNNETLRNSYIEKGLALKEKFSHINIANHLLSFLSPPLIKNQPYKIHEINTDIPPSIASPILIPSPLNFNKNLDMILKEKLKNHLLQLSKIDSPTNSYLKYLKDNGFEPKVIYDIGSSMLHWTNEAKKYWPNATYILFDAFDPVEFLYEGYDYHMGVLSDSEKSVKFYQNDYLSGGNSYYREIAYNHFPEDKYVEKQTKTLDDVVKERGFPLPDFVKMVVQGSEVDIIKGGIETLKNVQKMIVRLQSMEYNKGAFTSDISVPIIEHLVNIKCTDPLFHNNGPDGDYCFTRV